MALVLDASVALCLAFRDEGLGYGASVLDAVGAHGALVPSIFWYEIRNALVVSERRDRITPARSNAFLALLAELPIASEAVPPEAGVLALARDLQLTVYDASYLELAVRHGVPLASLDTSLRAAGARVNVASWAAPAPE